MLSEKMEKAINDQINAETYSAYLYMAMAAWAEEKQLAGFAHWLKVQAQEEMTHALKFWGQVNERGAKVTLAEIAAPPSEWESPLAMAEAVLEHERKVTGLINNLMDIAMDERDHASVSFLQWFIDEQVEEEASADEIIGKLKLVQQTEGGLYLLDQEMGQRVFNMPVWLTI
jgi:ferritin